MDWILDCSWIQDGNRGDRDRLDYRLSTTPPLPIKAGTVLMESSLVGTPVLCTSKPPSLTGAYPRRSADLNTDLPPARKRITFCGPKFMPPLTFKKKPHLSSPNRVRDCACTELTPGVGYDVTMPVRTA